MQYGVIYDSLISRAQTRLTESTQYYEVHHILPKCMGGTNDPDNLVKLTPEEHYLAHQLLAKQHPTNRKLLYAAILMTASADGTRINNKLYGWIKRKRSELGRSEETKRKIGESNKLKLKGRKLPKEHADKIQKAKVGRKISAKGCDNIRAAKVGENNPMFGKDPWNKGVACREETKRKIGEANKGREKSPETIELLRKKAKEAWARKKADNET